MLRNKPGLVLETESSSYDVFLSIGDWMATNDPRESLPTPYLVDTAGAHCDSSGQSTTHG